MSKEKPSKATAAGRAYLDLQTKARQTGRTTDELLKLYSLEGFLARLATSAFVDDFVLKGGVLLAAYAARRPTRDVDLHACNISNDADSVMTRVLDIARISRTDGLNFDYDSADTEVIREDDEYSGIRVSLTARLSSANINFYLDINFGDPIWPAPTTVQLPLLLGGTVTLRGYPLHMVIAEKAITAVQRGAANTRWRDFADIVTLTSDHTISGDDFTHALRIVAQHRKAELAPLSKVLEGMEVIAQRKWDIWRKKQRLEYQLPAQFKDILNACTTLCDPALTGAAVGRSWNPVDKTWQ